jgi:hypothetical protein
VSEVAEVAYGFVTGTVAAVVQVFSAASAKRYRKRTLRRKLSDKRYEWRTIKRLADSISQDYEATRILLLEIGARRSEGEKEVWKLERK